MFENEMLNNTTFQIDFSKLAEGNKMTFYTQEQNSFDVILDTYITTKQQIGGYVNTAVNYYTSTETFQKYGQPVLDNIRKDPVYKATNEQIVQPVVKAHAALNNLVKTYGADVVATAIAKSRITGWDNLTVAEQEERVNNAKQVVGDIINIDTVVIAGTAGVKAAGGLAALKGAAASAKEINALNLAKVAADAKKLKELEKGTTVKPAGFPPYQNKIQQKQLGAAKFGKDNGKTNNKINKTCTNNPACKYPGKPYPISQEYFDTFAHDFAKGKITPGSTEELRAALAAQELGIIDEIKYRGDPDFPNREFGVDYTTEDALGNRKKYDVKEPWSNSLSNGKELRKFLKFTENDVNILINPINVTDSQLSNYIDKIKSLGISESRIKVVPRESIGPMVIDGVIK